MVFTKQNKAFSSPSITTDCRQAVRGVANCGRSGNSRLQMRSALGAGLGQRIGNAMPGDEAPERAIAHKFRSN